MPTINTLLLSFFIILLSACSGTAKGPVTGKEYKVQVGGWQDMDQYNRARENVIEDKNGVKGGEADCNVVDCPQMIRNSGEE